MCNNEPPSPSTWWANAQLTAPFGMQTLAAQPVHAGVRVTQVLGITATAFLAGQTATTSYLTTPSLLLAPAYVLIASRVHAMARLNVVNPTAHFWLGSGRRCG